MPKITSTSEAPDRVAAIREVRLLARQVEAVADVAAVVGHPEPSRLGPGDLLLHIAALRLAIPVEVASDDPALGHTPERTGGSLRVIPHRRSPCGASSWPP